MITKRHLGYAFIALGLLVIAGVLAANLIGARDPFLFHPPSGTRPAS